MNFTHKRKSILIDNLPKDLQDIIKNRDKYELIQSIYNPEIQIKDAFNWIEKESYYLLNFVVKFDNKYYMVFWSKFPLNNEPPKYKLWEKVWEVTNQSDE
jgi:hypothetical protein